MKKNIFACVMLFVAMVLPETKVVRRKVLQTKMDWGLESELINLLRTNLENKSEQNRELLNPLVISILNEETALKDKVTVYDLEELLTFLAEIDESLRIAFNYPVLYEKEGEIKNIYNDEHLKQLLI